MFTVLLKERQSGDESLYQCEYVKFFRGSSKDEYYDPGLLIQYKDGSIDHIGMVKEPESFRFEAFVMNASGQTVARYLL